MELYYDNGPVQLYHGDAREVLRAIPEKSVQCVVTSPPYWGLRDYGLPPLVWGGEPGCAHQWDMPIAGKSQSGSLDGSTLDGAPPGPERRPQWESAFCLSCGAWQGCLGLEPTPGLYVAHLVDVFREVRRMLRDDGTLWLNLGDSYAGSWGNYGGQNRGHGAQRSITHGSSAHQPSYDGLERWRPPTTNPPGLKPKDLVGIPWRVAFALQADGWWLRSDIIYAKRNPMPESVTDRPTKSHEYVFLLAKSKRYYYDQEAVREPVKPWNNGKMEAPSKHKSNVGPGTGYIQRRVQYAEIKRANRRSIWTIATQPYSAAHFAAFTEALVEPCVLAGCPPAGAIVDPFVGSGTTCVVAQKLGRRAVGVDLNADYLDLARRRLEQVSLPMPL